MLCHNGLFIEKWLKEKKASSTHNPPLGRTGVAEVEWGEAGEDGNRPGDTEAGGPPASPSAAGQRRGPQPAAP